MTTSKNDATKIGNKDLDVYSDKNFVAKDQVWRDYIQKTALSAKNWPETWGFLKAEDKNESGNNISQKKDSLNPLPKTTSGWIGWQNDEKIINLERYGVKGKKSILKSFNWPDEAAS